MKPIMHGERLLIFDLDDTIFETRSIGAKHFEGIFAHFRRLASRNYSKDSLDIIEKDLWRLPFDHVASRHQFSNELSKQWSRLINETQFCFTIDPFQDFECISATAYQKVLVTTGFKHLQEAKIAALGIASEFDDIHIDEIDSECRIFKSGIFKKVIQKAVLIVRITSSLEITRNPN